MASISKFRKSNKLRKRVLKLHETKDDTYDEDPWDTTSEDTQRTWQTDGAEDEPYSEEASEEDPEDSERAYDPELCLPYDRQSESKEKQLSQEEQCLA